MASGAREPRHFEAGNKVYFVTFNYDRSLEELFASALGAVYKLSDDDARQMVGHLPIVHVHGALFDGLNVSPYGSGINGGDKTNPKRDSQLIEQASREIVLVSEVNRLNQGNTAYSDARHYLERSDRIVFLGLGYHPGNVIREALENKLR